ncbi:hypothetical protein B2M20_12320 [Nitrobacter vulgaris]|uniref:Uncharacterized protein n=1 Tax=Nitrobacter vulgaris TaxID=29421 RepID=A0A1V4HXJ0_NITVU|nr:hypothetical protein B2M20_12320 [Nitrobacter vulgaris]
MKGDSISSEVTAIVTIIKHRGAMRQTDVACTKCGAGFRRLELVSLPNQGGEFRCPLCGEVLEAFNGDEAFVTHRLTVPPQKKRPGAAAAPGKSGAAGPKGSEDLASKK